MSSSLSMIAITSMRLLDNSCDSQFQLFTRLTRLPWFPWFFVILSGLLSSMTHISHLTWFPWLSALLYKHGSLDSHDSLECLDIHDFTDSCELACIPWFPVDSHDLHNHFTTHDLHDSCKLSTYSRTTRCSKTLLTLYVHLLEDYQVF